MAKFNKFSITLDPAKLDALSTKLDSVSRLGTGPREIYSNEEIQLRSVSETINIVRQEELIQNSQKTQEIIDQATDRDAYLKEDEPTINSVNNIYGKAAQIKSNPEDVAQAYEEISKKDASRLNNLILELDGKIIDTNKDKAFLNKVATQYNNTYHPNPPVSSTSVDPSITMDMVVDYLQTEYKVIISDQQRNVLRSQVNQASLAGAASSLTATGVQGQAGSQAISFAFNKNKQLTNIKVIGQINGIEESKGKDAKASVIADVSHLKSDKPSASKEGVKLLDYLPKYSPKFVEIKYESKNLPCAIHPSVHKMIKNHAKFKDLEPLKNFMRRQYNTINRYASSAKQSMMSPFKKNTNSQGRG